MGRTYLIAMVSGLYLWAQNQTPQAPEFEVASVKRHIVSGDSVQRAGIEETKTLIRIDNLSLRVLIEIAYGVKSFQVSGPKWLDTDVFDIDAKPPAEYQHDQLPGLLEKLLADRFQLKVHHESRPETVYALILAKGGSKLRDSGGTRTYLTIRPGLIEGKQRTITELKDGDFGILKWPSSAV